MPRLGKGAKAARKLTDEQAREIRLSQADSKDLANRYSLSIHSIRHIRSGLTYGPLRADERAALRRRSRAATDLPPLPWEVLLVSQPSPADGATAMRFDGQTLVEARSADDECKHGRLPGDRTPPCGCWPQEQTSRQEQLQRHVDRLRSTPTRREIAA